jgi:hypothetical protein
MLRVVLTFGLLVCAGLFAGPARADGEQAMTPPDKTGDARAPSRPGPPGFALTYDVYTGGLHAIRFDVTVETEADDYRTSVRLETAGIVGAVFDWRLRASSEGAWRDGKIVPQAYRTANVWKGRARTVGIDYAGGFAQRVFAEPPYSREDYDKVAPEMILGAMDPTSAVTALVLAAARGEGCRPTTAVYDGRRRYDANMTPLPAQELKPSRYAPFSGHAEGCRLTFERIAGFRPDRKRLQDLEVAIWLADVGVDFGVEGSKVPVRLELTTPWGNGFAHLVTARGAGGALVFGSADSGG